MNRIGEIHIAEGNYTEALEKLKIALTMMEIIKGKDSI